MNEQRIAQYVQLIQQLLACPNGQEPEILANNSELVDEGLVLTMQSIATQLDNENAAKFLRQMASELATIVGMSESNIDDFMEMLPTNPLSENQLSENQPILPADAQGYIQFIGELLQIEMESNSDIKVVYPFLAKHQDKLNANFPEIFATSMTELLNRMDDPKMIDGVVGIIQNTCIDISNFPLGSRANNIETSIAGYEVVLQMTPKETKPEKWAQTQNNLATAYLYRIKGSKADNLEKSIECYNTRAKFKRSENQGEQGEYAPN